MSYSQWQPLRKIPAQRHKRIPRYACRVWTLIDLPPYFWTSLLLVICDAVRQDKGIFRAWPRFHDAHEIVITARKLAMAFRQAGRGARQSAPEKPRGTALKYCYLSNFQPIHPNRSALKNTKIEPKIPLIPELVHLNDFGWLPTHPIAENCTSNMRHLCILPGQNADAFAGAWAPATTGCTGVETKCRKNHPWQGNLTI